MPNFAEQNKEISIFPWTFHIKLSHQAKQRTIIFLFLKV